MDFANASARSLPPESSDEMSDNEWIGALNLNGTRIPVRALMAEAVGEPPNLSALPNELAVEPPDGPNLSTLDIQVWIRENKVPTVPLSSVDGTNNSDFDQLVQNIRARGYAIVRWNDKDRLLLAPLSDFLLCAAFPEKATPKRPTSQPPRKVRTLTLTRTKVRPSQEKDSLRSQKNKKQKSRQGPQLYPATTSNFSSNYSCDEQCPDTATRSSITQQPQPEWPQVPHNLQVTMEPMQGEINPSSQWLQTGGFEQPQMILQPQLQAEQHPYPQVLWGVMSAHREQPASCASHPSTSCMADSSNLNSEAPEALEMNGWSRWIDYTGCGLNESAP